MPSNARWAIIPKLQPTAAIFSIGLKCPFTPYFVENLPYSEIKSLQMVKKIRFYGLNHNHPSSCQNQYSPFTIQLSSLPLCCFFGNNTECCFVSMYLNFDFQNLTGSVVATETKKWLCFARRTDLFDRRAATVKQIRKMLLFCLK